MFVGKGGLTYVLGEWEIDLTCRELRLRGNKVRIGARAFEIVEVLVKAGGELVTKDDLMVRIWPGAFVEENTLQVHIVAVRKALGGDRNLLKTISGRGYRLVGQWVARPAEALQSQDEPELPPSSTFETNLPIARSELIGRVQAVQHVRDLVSAYRVVTLTGPGGVGKTRLAVEVARSLLATFSGNIWLVELASVSDPSLIASTIASTFRLSLDQNEVAIESVAQLIGNKQILLLIDNCEHVVDAVSTSVETLMKACPNTSILATSRELLRVDGERAYNVPALDVPPAAEQAADRILRHSSVQLFRARMEALRFGFAPTPGDLAAMAHICRCLDGLALAIELAAARAATLGLDAVIAGLSDRIGLLTVSRPRSSLPRHSTLRAMLDWSYELLPEVERLLFRSLAVFVGGFSIEAAIAVVCHPEGAGATIDGLSSLVEKSLVIFESGPPFARWRLFQIARAYGIEKLDENGELDLAARRHAEYFRDFAAATSGVSTSSDFGDRVIIFAREIDNVRAALDWAFSPNGDTEIGIMLTFSYVPVWLYLWLTEECNRCVERALDRLQPELPRSADLEMRLRLQLSSALVRSLGSLTRVKPLANRALELAENLNDLDSQIVALWVSYSFHSIRGEQQLAMSFAERFQNVAGQTKDLAKILVGERIAGTTLHYLGDQTRARPYLDRMFQAYTHTANQRRPNWLHFDQRVSGRALLARVLWLQGFVDRAQAEASASIAHVDNNGPDVQLRYPLAWATFPIALAVGDIAGAERALARLLGLRQVSNQKFWRGTGRCLEGSLLIRQGEYKEGVIAIRGGLDTCVETGWTTYYSAFLVVFAEGLAAIGQHTQALAAIEHAIEWSNRTGECWYDAELYRIKGELILNASPAQFAAARICFRKGKLVARQQGALFWELRLAMSHARLIMRHDGLDDPRQELADVYNRFTEGFETTDLLAATAMLETIAAAGWSPRNIHT